MNRILTSLLAVLSLFIATNSFAQPTPPGGGAGSGGGPSSFNSPQYGSNDFWLEALSFGTNIYNSDPTSLTLILHGTARDLIYQLLSTTNLQPGNALWTVEQTLSGSDITNFTVTAVPIGNETVKCFKALAYSYDSDGDGLPDWWEQQYSTASFPLSFTNADTGDTGSSDGYKMDAAGDGYNNLQKFQMGIPPGTWVTPQPPGNFTTVLNSNGNSAALSWNAASGSVQSYTIFADNNTGNGFVVLTNIPGTATSFTDNATDFHFGIRYEIQANYAGGSSYLSAPNDPHANSPYQLTTFFVRGPGGRINLVLPAVSQNVQAIRIYLRGYFSECDFWSSRYGEVYLGTTFPQADHSFDVPINDFTNGIYSIPESQLPFYTPETPVASAIPNTGPLGPESTGYFIPHAPFLDGTIHMGQNLSFLFQEATQADPFQLFDYLPGYATFPVFTCPSNYAVAGFYGSPNYTFATQFLNEFLPFEDNYCYRNYIFTSSADLLPDGFPNTGLAFTDYTDGDGGYPASFTNLVTKYYFDTGAFASSGQTVPPTSILTNWLWTFPTQLFPAQVYGYGYPFGESLLEQLGLSYVGSSSPPHFQFDGGANLYGLNIVSVKTATTNAAGNLTFATVASGTPLSIPTNYGYNFYTQVDPPQFRLAGQYFGRPGNDPLPGDDGFAITNETPPIIIYGIGQQFTVTGWAKEALQNGGPDAFGYLQWYFDKAYLGDDNGSITTDQTGVLSEYGEFLPTQPGEVFLTTRTNALGQFATNAVQIISLCVDGNHDGVMDTSLTGPDTTFAIKPYIFWVNNDYDRNDTSGTNQDDFESASNPSPLSRFLGGPPMADCNYTNISGQRAIPCTRDLEDYARLWLAGFTTNLLANLPSGSTVTLNWGDVGSPNSSNPTIDLFQAADADGGMGYLTNSVTAASQINPNLCQFVGRLAPGGSIQLNAGTFSNSWAGNHFIWCGVNYGNGGLNLTIQDANSNILAQTTAYFQINDIKQMYERWTAGDAPSLAPTNACLAENDLPPGFTKFQYPAPIDTNTPYILFVHGWNMKPFEKDRWAETAYKRLYWQGYQGRFGSFRWPTGYGFSSIISVLTDANNYNSSELRAWQSGQFLKDRLVNLNTEYSGNVYMLAHSMGNVVAGEALRLAGTNVIVNTYVASQAAISARAYDNTIPADATNSYTPHVFTPDSEGHYYTNGAPSYFNDIGGAVNFVDFYNEEDYALHYWVIDQNLKADSLSYHYATPTSQFPSGYYYAPPFTIGQSLVFPTNAYVIFAQAAQSYSLALGAETSIATRFLGSISVNLDVPPHSFGRDHVGHSLEFRNDNMTSTPYWHQLLISFTIQP